MNIQVLEARRDAVAALLHSGLDGLLRGDVEPWIAMFADHGQMEFPFAPPGTVTRRGDKAQIREHMAAFPQMFRLNRVAGLAIHQTLDADIAVAEFGVEGQALATGNPYNQRYVAVITVRDGLIVHYRDYWNPLVVLQALDNGSAMHEAFKSKENPS